MEGRDLVTENQSVLRPLFKESEEFGGYCIWIECDE